MRNTEIKIYLGRTLALASLFVVGCGGINERSAESELNTETSNTIEPPPQEPLPLPEIPEASPHLEPKLSIALASNPKTKFELTETDYIIPETEKAVLLNQRNDHEVIVESEFAPATANSSPVKMRMGTLNRSKNHFIVQNDNSFITKIKTFSPDPSLKQAMSQMRFLVRKQKFPVKIYIEAEEVIFKNQTPKTAERIPFQYERELDVTANVECTDQCKSLNFYFEKSEENKTEEYHRLFSLLEKPDQTLATVDFGNYHEKMCVEFNKRPAQWTFLIPKITCTLKPESNTCRVEHHRNKIETLPIAQVSATYYGLCSKESMVAFRSKVWKNTLKLKYARIVLNSKTDAIYIIPPVERPNVQLLPQEIRFQWYFGTISAFGTIRYVPKAP